MSINGMSAQQALHYIEALRLGIPPNENISYFTVGRQAEINALSSLLRSPKQRIKLLQANYGSGKTHLLKLLREEALRHNFSVSLLTLDGKSGIRFSKLDEIFGAICRHVEGPGWSGVEGLLDAITSSPNPEAMKVQKYRMYLRNQSPHIRDAVGWWVRSSCPPSARQAIVEWLNHPHHFTTRPQQEELYKQLVGKQYLNSGDRDALAQVRRDGTFKWSDSSDYTRTWNALAELYKLTQIANTNGLILLIDEFEDVVTNLTGPQQRIAFSHLFSFYSGAFPGLAVFAVTPDFVEKCKDVLRRKEIRDYSVLDFERLPSLVFSSLGDLELYEFSCRVLELYEFAYQLRFRNREHILHSLRQLSLQSHHSTTPDLPRQIAKQSTRILDAYLED